MTTASMPTILMTGFEPFGGESINPSQLAIEKLHRKVIAHHQILGIVLPCTFASSAKRLIDAIEKSSPALVICVGQGKAFQLEQTANNLINAAIADNDDKQPSQTLIVVDGPAKIESTLPLQHIMQKLSQEHIVASVSSHAGSFVCNYVFYHLMRALEKHKEIREEALCTCHC